MKPIDRRELEERFKAAQLLLLELAHRISTQENIDPVELLRADALNISVEWLQTMKQSLLDTYDIPWDDYKEKFEKYLEKAKYEASIKGGKQDD